VLNFRQVLKQWVVPLVRRNGMEDRLTPHFRPGSMWTVGLRFASVAKTSRASRNGTWQPLLSSIAYTKIHHQRQRQAHLFFVAFLSSSKRQEGCLQPRPTMLRRTKLDESIGSRAVKLKLFQLVRSDDRPSQTDLTSASPITQTHRTPLNEM